MDHRPSITYRVRTQAQGAGRILRRARRRARENQMIMNSNGTCNYCAPEIRESLIDRIRSIAQFAYNWLYLKAVAFSYFVAKVL